MKIFKYCPCEFNPNSGNRIIRMGSTKYFRDNYNGEADEDLINDWLEGLSMKIDGDNNRFVRKIAPDSYIFCAATEQIPMTDATNPLDPSYKSCYCISNAENFARELGRHALDHINETFVIEDFHPIAQAFIADYMKANKIDFSSFKNELKIELHWDIVHYKKGEIPHDAIKSLQFKFWVSSYLKLKKFDVQKEYRISFTIYHPNSNQTFDIIKPDILIRFNNIMNFIEPLNE